MSDAFETGTAVTAKVLWLPQGRYEDDDASHPVNRRTPGMHYVNISTGAGHGGDGSRTRYISCTPLLGSDDQVGVWMVVMVENEQVTGTLASREAAWRRFGEGVPTPSESDRGDDAWSVPKRGKRIDSAEPGMLYAEFLRAQHRGRAKGGLGEGVGEIERNGIIGISEREREGTMTSRTDREGTMNSGRDQEGTMNSGRDRGGMMLNSRTDREGTMNSGRGREGVMINEGREREGVVNSGRDREGMINGGREREFMIDGGREREAMINDGRGSETMSNGGRERLGITIGGVERDGMIIGAREQRDGMIHGGREQREGMMINERRDRSGMAFAGGDRDGMMISEKERDGMLMMNMLEGIGEQGK